MTSRSTLLGQHATADCGGLLPTPLLQLNNISKPGVSGLSRFNAGSNEDGDTTKPSLLDLSEFPSLTTCSVGDQAPSTALPPPGHTPYVGMVKQPTTEQSEFTMSSEDFPELPGTSTAREAPPKPVDYAKHANEQRKGIQSAPDGTVTSVPKTMILNQYGMAGLVAFIRAAELDPGVASVALGQDLTELGLDLNSPDKLLHTFAGPFADAACKPQDVDYNLPAEYRINGSIREKLAPLRLSRHKEDVLFYLFYCSVGDALQIDAAAELYNREWRFHTEEKLWLSQAPGMPVLEKTSTYERGTYYFFDAHNWRKVAKEFYLEYSKLEGRPQQP